MKGRLALGTAALLSVLGAGCSSSPHAAAHHGTTTSSTTATTKPAKTSVPPSSTPPTTPTTLSSTSTTLSSTSTTLFGTPQVAGTKIFSQVGEGDGTSRQFTIPGGTKQWDLAWEYDCPGSNNRGNFTFGNFDFSVYKGRTRDKKDSGTGGGQATLQGTQHYTDTGTFSIHVGSQPTCTWSLTALVPTS
jgi:hypothetical protein